jgi:putative transposase
MQKWRQWETASKADWKTALEREAVIRVLAEEHELTGERVREAMQRLNLSRSVIYKLLHRFRQRPQTSSLLPWKRGLRSCMVPPRTGRAALANGF